MKNWFTKVGLIIAGIILIILIAFKYPPFRDAILRRMVRIAMKKKNVQYPDGLYAGLCGTGCPLPDIRRAGPCIAVMAGKHFFVVDAGQGSTRNLLLMNLPLRNADALLLTHFHSDHIADVGEMELQHWAGGSNHEPLNVIGPTGVDSVVAGFNLAYRLDDGYRIAHHGPETMPPSGAGGIARPFALSAESDASVVVFESDGVKVTAFKVDHRPVEPAVGYRFDYKGRSVVISGDTRYSESLMEHAKGADILFHEALNKELVNMIHDNADLSGSPSLGKVTHDILSYHSSPEDAAKVAAGAGVRRLVYYHIIPPLPFAILRRIFPGDAGKYYKGPITMGEDGMLFFLAPGSDKIEMKNTLH